MAFIALPDGNSGGEKIYTGGSPNFDENTGRYIGPVPQTPTKASVASSTAPSPTKTAPIDTVLFDDQSMSLEIMTDLIFEDIGGHE